MVAQRDAIQKMTDGPAKEKALLEWQMPRNGVPLVAERVFVGRDRSKSAVIQLSDLNGRPRLRLKVDAAGEASIEFLDEKGTVTARLPD